MDLRHRRTRDCKAETLLLAALIVSLLKTRPSRFSCVLRTDQAIRPVMVRWLGILLGTLRSTVRTHRELTLENLALRQQLAGWKALQPRPRVTATDRIFWVALSRLWKSWRNSLQMVRPETAVGWHRQGFRRYWAWKSGRRRGRPAIRTELRDLIRHQPRQSSMGCAEDSRRAAEAGPDGIAGDGFEVHAP